MLKPGDRVRLTYSLDHANAQKRGDTGVVEDVPSTSNYIGVRWDNGSYDPRWDSKWLALELPLEQPDPTNYTEYYDAITEG